jgi:hypothetical protein
MTEKRSDTPPLTLVEKIDSLAKRLTATTEFHPDAHTVYEAGIVLLKMQEELITLRQSAREQISNLHAALAVAQSSETGTKRVAVPVREILWALEREAANTDDSPQWRAASELRQMTQWQTRTLICDVGPQTLVTEAPNGK